MKVALVVMIVFSSGLVGYLYKRKLKENYELLKFISAFETFYNSNMTLFKNDVQEIIERYIIMQKNKNAKYCKLFLKNNNIYSFDKNILMLYLNNKTNNEIIEKYLSEIGKNDYEFEKEKNKNFEQFMAASIDNAEKMMNTNGNLVFKLSLAIGAVLGIVLW